MNSVDAPAPPPALLEIDALCRVVAATVRVARVEGTDALSWALTRPVPALGGVTPFEAITAGREADVLGYLAGLPDPPPASRHRRKSP